MTAGFTHVVLIIRGSETPWYTVGVTGQNLARGRDSVADMCSLF